MSGTMCEVAYEAMSGAMGEAMERSMNEPLCGTLRGSTIGAMNKEWTR